MTLEEFIQNNPDPRELKRAIAVKMRQSGYAHREIQNILIVASSFISKWERRYRENGVEGLKLRYSGRVSYLSISERNEVISWLQRQEEWNLDKLIKYVQQQYQVSYGSSQSYYNLFADAGICWNKKNNLK